VSLEDRLYPLLAVYQRLPRRVRYALGGAYARLPQHWRLGARYAEFSELAAEGERWSDDARRAYQVTQLRAVLLHAGTHCAFYRTRFARAGFRPEDVHDLEDLAACPPTTKQDLLDHLPELVSAHCPPSDRLYMTTGGSTGVPVGFYLQKGVSRAKEQAFLEAMWRRAGYFDGARLAVIRGYVTSSKAGGPITSYDATRDWLMLSSYHLTPERLPDYLDALERFRPDLLHAYPSAALQLAAHMERAGRPWTVPLRAVLCGSERLTLPQKRLLERVFNCRVYRWYGHAERVVLAGEGTTSDLLYFFPQYGHVEFGPPDAHGLREVIGTSFHNLAMPLIRYHTGDFVRLPEAKDDAREYPWPAVADVVGREQEFLVTATGRMVSMTAFNMHDETFDDLYAVQFFQDEPGAAELRYVPGPRFHHSRLVTIDRRVRQKLGDDFRVSYRAVTEVEKTPRGKHRWLVSTLAEAGATSPPSLLSVE
jgi:phenylacetate-CoA ligase